MVSGFVLMACHAYLFPAVSFTTRQITNNRRTIARHDHAPSTFLLGSSIRYRYVVTVTLYCGE